MNMYEPAERLEEVSAMEYGATLPEKSLPATGVVFYVVGDKFAEFADNNVILNISDALQQSKTIAHIAKCLVVGQGVDAEETKLLQEKLRIFNTVRSVPVLHRFNEKIKKELVDKLDDKNVLITHPEQKAPLHFSSHLVLDKHCSAITDHTASEHIQGALLIEAARQLFMASVRTYDVAPAFAADPEEIRFTLSALQVRFDNFVFPLAAQLHLTLTDIHIDTFSATGTATIKIIQLDRQCCEIIFNARAHTLKYFSSLEKRCAIKAKRRLDFTKVYF